MEKMALGVDDLSRRKLLPSQYAAIAASFAAIVFVLTVTNLPFHAVMRPLPVLLQKSGMYTLWIVDPRLMLTTFTQETLNFSRGRTFQAIFQLFKSDCG